MAVETVNRQPERRQLAGVWPVMSKTEAAKLLCTHTHASKRTEEREGGGVGDCPGGQTAAGDRPTAGAVAGGSEAEQRGGWSRNVRKERGVLCVFLAPLFPFYFFIFLSTNKNTNPLIP